MLADEENVSGHEAENEIEQVADAGAWEELGIVVTRGFSTSIQGNLPSPIYR